MTLSLKQFPIEPILQRFKHTNTGESKLTIKCKHWESYRYIHIPDDRESSRYSADQDGAPWMDHHVG